MIHLPDQVNATPLYVNQHLPAWLGFDHPINALVTLPHPRYLETSVNRRTYALQRRHLSQDLGMLVAIGKPLEIAPPLYVIEALPSAHQCREQGAHRRPHLGTPQQLLTCPQLVRSGKFVAPKSRPFVQKTARRQEHSRHFTQESLDSLRRPARPTCVFREAIPQRRFSAHQ